MNLQNSLLEKPTSGSVLINSHDLPSLMGAALREKRRARHHLPTVSA